MTPLNNLNCFKCLNLGIKGCKAFTDGIPNIIISGENDHSKPLPEQDNDIVFEKI